MTVVTAGLDQVTEQFEPAPPRKRPTSWLLTVFMLVCLGYFLLPLFWLVVASTKSNADLFSSFGLWFADFNLIENIQTVLTVQDGVFIRWAVNSFIYAGSITLIDVVTSTLIGYILIKHPSKLGTIVFWTVRGDSGGASVSSAVHRKGPTALPVMLPLMVSYWLSVGCGYSE